MKDKLFIQKIVPIYQKEIYEYLIANPISNTPKIYDLKVDGDNLVVSCEYIEGTTLTDYLNNLFLNIAKNQKNSIVKTFYSHCFSLLNIVQNLQHSKIIIHRDIKPDNIIITNDSDLYLIDFGSAKILTNDKTKDTRLLVSDGYAAPEQYGFGSSNKSTDIYAIGKIVSDYLEIINDPMLSKKISPIVEKCCKIDYKDRYKDINQVKLDLFRAKHNVMFLAIPGYRSNNLLHILVSTFFYILLIYICFIDTYIDIMPLNIIIFISAISFVLIFFNYLDIHKFLPFAKSKNLFLKYLCVALYSIIIPIGLILSFILLYK